ncbi:hypothetical protein EYF80_007788 [Liparis tanakae]|uniref:Uncharacterized protein n=1 Tax=Liparis tanakae TaxID=230148 RepID=A0A4Z2IV74_9TELE|nr:hypothetical protein EYF80_007788 [Liparis tanakae]
MKDRLDVIGMTAHLEQYISRLAHQYQSRVTSSTSDLTSSATPEPGTGGQSQKWQLWSFEERLCLSFYSLCYITLLRYADPSTSDSPSHFNMSKQPEPPQFPGGHFRRSSFIQESSPSPKISEDFPMVEEISRLSGLSRSVVVGLMEQGVELDIDCFQTDNAGEPPAPPPGADPLPGSPALPSGCHPALRFPPGYALPVLPASHQHKELSFGAKWCPSKGWITSAEWGISSYAKREDHRSDWAEEQEVERSAAQTPRKNSNKLWRGFEGRLWGKESESEREEMDRAEYGYGWKRSSIGSWRREHRRGKASSSSNDKRPKVENSPIFSKKRGKEDGERRSTSLRLSRRALFRSES